MFRILFSVNFKFNVDSVCYAAQLKILTPNMLNSSFSFHTMYSNRLSSRNTILTKLPSVSANDAGNERCHRLISRSRLHLYTFKLENGHKRTNIIEFNTYLEISCFATFAFATHEHVRFCLSRTSASSIEKGFFSQFAIVRLLFFGCHVLL